MGGVKIPAFIRRAGWLITKAQQDATGAAMQRTTTALILLTVALAGCNRISGLGSGFSGWFSPQSRGATTLEPKGGYPTSADEGRVLVPAITSARFEAIPEGRLLVVVANAGTKGWWDVELVTATPQPKGRYQPDEDGVLRLRLVGNPPREGSVEARTPADPRVDSITVALPLSFVAMAGVEAVQITSAQNTVTARR